MFIHYLLPHEMQKVRYNTYLYPLELHRGESVLLCKGLSEVSDTCS